MIALTDVEVGEEVTISYIGGVLESKRTAYLFLPNSLRKDKLLSLFGFECLCDRCRGNQVQELEQELSEKVKEVEDLPANILDQDAKVRSFFLYPKFYDKEKSFALVFFKTLTVRLLSTMTLCSSLHFFLQRLVCRWS